MRSWTVLAITVASTMLCGCDSDDPGADAGVDDAGTTDAGVDDAGAGDAGLALPGPGECAPESWPADREAFEAELLRLLNERRAAGGPCGGMDIPARSALTLNPDGSGVARLHAAYVAEGGPVADPDEFWPDRLAACSPGVPTGSAIITVTETAAAQVAELDCLFVLMDPWTTVSIGHVPGPLPTTVVYPR